jgi:hypothetical protein
LLVVTIDRSLSISNGFREGFEGSSVGSSNGSDGLLTVKEGFSIGDKTGISLGDKDGLDGISI